MVFSLLAMADSSLFTGVVDGLCGHVLIFAEWDLDTTEVGTHLRVKDTKTHLAVLISSRLSANSPSLMFMLMPNQGASGSTDSAALSMPYLNLAKVREAMACKCQIL